jgi:leucyl aminopeptidase (aminopeptidase T)
MSLAKAAEVAVRECMGVKHYEKVLIITDKNKIMIGKALYEQAEKCSAKAWIIEIPIGRRHGEEPPAWVNKEMLQYDVILIPTTRSLSHTKARKDAMKKGARIASMPGITEDIMIRGLNADYRRIKERTDSLREILDKGKKVVVTTGRGTEISMDIGGRKCLRGTGIFHNKGEWGNLPAGGACLAPVEGTAEGVFMVDASMGGIGKVDKLITIKVKKGYAVKIEGGQSAEKLKEMLDGLGKKAYNIAELGIGTNDTSRISGTVLEDEKVLGTAHIALGNNLSYGGKVDVPIHTDGVFFSPTIKVDDKVVMEKGKLLI